MMQGQPLLNEHGCSALWGMVIERAVRDLRFIDSAATRELTRNDHAKLTRMLQFGHPADWFGSDDFETVCRLANLDARVVRERASGMGLI